MSPQPNLLDIQYDFYLIYQLITSPWNVSNNPSFIFWSSLIWIIFLILSIIFFVGIFYFSTRIFKLRQEETREIFGWPGTVAEMSKLAPKNERWERILKNMDSDNPSDWNVSIIEADKILDEIVTDVVHAQGETLGEKLKTIESSDFLTLNDAWEAHKIRNRIAHENDFVLTRREARHAIDLYRHVFEEFTYI